MGRPKAKSRFHVLLDREHARLDEGDTRVSPQSPDVPDPTHPRGRDLPATELDRAIGRAPYKGVVQRVRAEALAKDCTPLLPYEPPAVALPLPPPLPIVRRSWWGRFWGWLQRLADDAA